MSNCIVTISQHKFWITGQNWVSDAYFIFTPITSDHTYAFDTALHLSINIFTGLKLLKENMIPGFSCQNIVVTFCYWNTSTVRPFDKKTNDSAWTKLTVGKKNETKIFLQITNTLSYQKRIRHSKGVLPETIKQCSMILTAETSIPAILRHVPNEGMLFWHPYHKAQPYQTGILHRSSNLIDTQIFQTHKPSTIQAELRPRVFSPYVKHEDRGDENQRHH